jgi:hypothetical protein
MVTTALGIAAASWAILMALSPILQVREIVRRGSSEGISIGYSASCSSVSDCGCRMGWQGTTCRSSSPTASRSSSWDARSRSFLRTR